MKKQTIFLLSLFVVVTVIIIAGQLFLRREAVEPVVEDNSVRIVPSVASVTRFPSPTLSVSGLITVSVDYGDGQKITGSVNAKTAYEAIQVLAREKGIAVETKQFKYGFLVVKIDSRESGQGGTWQYYIDGKLGVISPGLAATRAGARVEWKFEK